MSALPSRSNESWRVLAVAAALALAFIGLERLELALFDLFGADNLLARTRPAGADAKLGAQADALAARSNAAWASLPAGHRAAAFRIGYEVGWASEFTGSLTRSPADLQARAAPIAAAHLALAREQALRIGIDPAAVAALPMRTVADFNRIEERFDADESGLAQRVEERLTPVHRHLFLLGAHVGVASATIESTGGQLNPQPIAAVHREATLAGIPAAAWQPLVQDAHGAPPALVLERHRAALDGLLAELANDASGR